MLMSCKMMARNQFGFECLWLFLLLLHCQLSSLNAAAPYGQFKREPQSAQQKSQQQSPQAALQSHVQSQSHGLQEKDELQTMMKHTDVADAFGDPYQMLHELKQDQRVTAAAAAPPPTAPASPAAAAASMYWHQNPYMNQASNQPSYGQPNFAAPTYNAAAPSPFSAPSPSMFETPRFFPFFGFPQPMFIPLPVFYPPPAEMLYSMYPAMNNFEDVMSRAAGGGRRPSAHARDSPIYYMRLPPTPYMFLPNFGYTPATPSFGAGFSPFFSPYQPVSAFSGLSPTFNLPLSFMANGKPSGIYQMTSPPTNELQNSYTGMNINNFNSRPAMQSNGFNGNYAPPSYGLTAPAQSSTLAQDSRMTLLKQPFIFNGRPDEMYILQNSFNPMFGGI